MSQIAHDLPQILQLVDHALAHSKQLQVNADGGVQLATFGTKVLRALNGIGQSDDWKLQQQHKVASAVRSAIESSLSHAGTEAVANKYDRLFHQVREINLTAAPGELPVQRYVEALQRFDRVDTLNLAQSGLPAGATAESSAVAGPQDYRPLQDVRASLAAERMVEHELRQLDPELASTLGNWLDSYRQEAQAMPVAAEPAQRAAQGAQLLARLTVLANSVDQAVHQSPLSAKAGAALDRLGERISGEIHLIGAVIANKLSRDAGPEVSWRQAVELRRLGIDLQDGVLFGGHLQGHSVKHLAGGAMNQVYTVLDEQGQKYVYKPGKAHEAELESAVQNLARKKGADVLSPNIVNDHLYGSDNPNRDGGKGRVSDMRYEARNVAGSRLDALLGTQVVVPSRLALLPKELLPIKQIDQSDQRERDEKFANFGLLMDKAAGDDAHKVTQSPAFGNIRRDPALLRDLSNLQLVDCILCSLDRHAGNYMIDIGPDGTYHGLKGIDNDFSLSDGVFDVALFEELTETEKRLLSGQTVYALKEKESDVYQLAANQNIKVLNRLLTQHGGDLSADVQTRVRELCAKYISDLGAMHYKKWEGSPEALAMVTQLCKDVRAAGLPDGHPVALYVDRCAWFQEQLADIQQQQQALMDHLKAIGKVQNLMESDPVHNVGLPNVADLRTTQLILQPDFEARMVAAFRSLLTPSEVKSAVQRLQTVQAHLRDLETQGRLLDETQWRMDHVDAKGRTVGELLSDAHHNHIARLDFKFEEWQAKEAAKAAKAAPAAGAAV